MTEILTELGYEKNKKVGVGAMMVLGTVIVGQIANSCTPISHAMSITGMTTYTSYTGGTIDFFTFCAVLTPLAIVCLVLWFIIAKYIWEAGHLQLQGDKFRQTGGFLRQKGQA